MRAVVFTRQNSDLFTFFNTFLEDSASLRSQMFSRCPHSLMHYSPEALLRHCWLTLLWPEVDIVGNQGLVEAVGVSNYGPQQLQKIAKYLAARDVPLVTAQVCQCFAGLWLD